MAERFARGGRLLGHRRRLGRPPRGGRVRASGDRRQAGAARARPSRAAQLDAAGGARRHGDRVRRRGRRDTPALRDRARPARGRSVHPPGADRDRLPRAVGARARLPRAQRARPSTTPARRASSIRSSASARPTTRRSRRRAALDPDEGRGDRRAARADAHRGPRRRCSPRREALRGGRRRVLALGNGGSATDAMDAGRRPRSAPGRRGARPHRGPGDPDRDRQRRRRRGDLRPPGDRLRPRPATRWSRSRPAAARRT